MKKLILAAAVLLALSGCAVYPVGAEVYAPVPVYHPYYAQPIVVPVFGFGGYGYRGGFRHR